MKILRFLDNNLEAMIVSTLLFTMSILVGLQVFMRYVMRNSLSWSEELARYCMVWLVYVGVSYAVKKNMHIRVDVINLVLSDRMKKAVAVFANLMFLAFAVIVVWLGYGMAMRIARLEQTSPGLEIPMACVYMAVPCGLGLSAIRLVQSLIVVIKGDKSPAAGEEERVLPPAERGGEGKP